MDTVVPTAAACHGGWTGGDGEQSRGQDRTGWRRRAEHPMSDGVVDVELLTHGFRLDNAPAPAPALLCWKDHAHTTLHM